MPSDSSNSICYFLMETTLAIVAISKEGKAFAVFIREEFAFLEHKPWFVVKFDAEATLFERRPGELTVSSPHESRVDSSDRERRDAMLACRHQFVLEGKSKLHVCFVALRSCSSAIASPPFPPFSIFQS